MDHRICHPCSCSSVVEMDVNMLSTHPSVQGAHASIFRFYASDLIFTNADCGLFKLEMRFNSFRSFVLTLDSLLSIRYFPNWNEPIQAEALGGRNYQPTFSYSCCCNVVYVSPQRIYFVPQHHSVIEIRVFYFVFLAIKWFRLVERLLHLFL